MAPASEPGKRRLLKLTTLLVVLLLSTAACVNDLIPSGGWSGPVESNGHVYVGGKDGHLVRMDAQTGRFDPSFRYPQGDGVGAIYGKPALAHGVVYAAGYECTGNRCDAQVFAVNPATGESAWGEGPFRLETRLVGGVAVSPDVLVFGTTRITQVEDPKGFLYALNPVPDANLAPGLTIGDRFLWRIPVDQSIWGQPVIADDVAYFGTLAGTLYAVDLLDRPQYDGSPQARVLWTFTAESIVNATPVIQDGKIYFGDFANNFYALDLETRATARSGSTINPSTEWVADVHGWVWASALIDGNTIYVGTLGGKVYAFERKTGAEIWNQPAQVDGQVVARPAIVETGSVRTLAVPSSDQDVHVITLVDGANTGRRYNTNDGVMSEPLVTNDSIFVHSVDGQLRRFHPSSLNVLDCFKTQDGGRC